MDEAESADFCVQPTALTVYADLADSESDEVAAVADTLAAVTVQPSWFGRLPQSGHLADGYRTHRDQSLALLREIPQDLAAIASALEQNAVRYDTADQAIADQFEALGGET